ncbi:MAG: HAD family hydrolase [Lachnospiraceae bacterium]|nr:HAD family hydrolase [Lachnospiraceae bacterium]
MIDKDSILLFDIDDTLYLRNVPFIRACEECLSGRIQLDWDRLFKARNIYSDAILSRQKEQQISNETLYYLRMKQALADFGQDITPQEVEVFEESYRRFQGDIQLYDGYEELFEELKARGNTMGLITNGNVPMQEAKIRVLGLERWIPREHWFITENMCAVKPQEPLYRQVEQLLGVTDPSRFWYIGDNYPMDVEGAVHAGWHAIWFNANGDLLPASVRYHPEGRVTNTRELRRFLLE